MNCANIIIVGKTGAGKSIFEVINRFNCERRSTEMELRAEDIRRMRI